MVVVSVLISSNDPMSSAILNNYFRNTENTPFFYTNISLSRSNMIIVKQCKFCIVLNRNPNKTLIFLIKMAQQQSTNVNAYIARH